MQPSKISSDNLAELTDLTKLAAAEPVATGSVSESEAKNDTSFFSRPFTAIAAAVSNFFTSAIALFRGAAQFLGFFKDTSTEVASGASTPAVQGPTGPGTGSYSSIAADLGPAIAAAPAKSPSPAPLAPNAGKPSSEFSSVLSSEADLAAVPAEEERTDSPSDAFSSGM